MRNHKTKLKNRFSPSQKEPMHRFRAIPLPWWSRPTIWNRRLKSQELNNSLTRTRKHNFQVREVTRPPQSLKKALAGGTFSSRRSSKNKTYLWGWYLGKVRKMTVLYLRGSKINNLTLMISLRCTIRKMLKYTILTETAIKILLIDKVRLLLTRIVFHLLQWTKLKMKHINLL